MKYVQYVNINVGNISCLWKSNKVLLNSVLTNIEFWPFFAASTNFYLLKYRPSSANTNDWNYDHVVVE